MTTGPITVAFAADPTAGGGLWWQSETPYRSYVDVALNNPTRWHRVSADQVVDPDLQCRNESQTDCYTNYRPTLSTDVGDVWSSPFYSMKGLLVTEGGTTGPLRNTATVGDEIFLQARVYNYSLKTMDSGTKVYARFYRQQLDVNNDNGSFAVLGYAEDSDGNPLPAVPIGPGGLGDSTPVPVVSPEDGSATIPPFNNSLNADPSQDNISLATTSYTAADNDDCDYDNGVQSCNGAYYAYWVTVWAEDSSGNVIAELPGHGLPITTSGSTELFDPARIYQFITDVPLESVTLSSGPPPITDSFTNNVGMFKMVFSIVPAESSSTLTAGATRPRPGPLSLDRLHISSDKTVLGEPVVVSAQVVEDGESAPDATVVFSDGDPQNGGKTFDAEWLPTIRAHDRHFVSVNYNPESCGRHAIYADVTSGSNVAPAEQIAMVDVGIDYQSVITYLIKRLKELALPPNNGHEQKPGQFMQDGKRFDAWNNKGNDKGKPHLEKVSDKDKAHKYRLDKARVRELIRQLTLAKKAFDAGRTSKAVFFLKKVSSKILKHKLDERIDPQKADALIAQLERIIGCV